MGGAGGLILYRQDRRAARGRIQAARSPLARTRPFAGPLTRRGPGPIGQGGRRQARRLAIASAGRSPRLAVGSWCGLTVRGPGDGGCPGRGRPSPCISRRVFRSFLSESFGSFCFESLPIILSNRAKSSSGPAGGASDGLGRGAAGPDRLCPTTAAGALRVIV